MSNDSNQILRFFKHSGVYAIGNVLNRAGALILLPLYTNYLIPSEYGALELFYVVSAVFSGFLSVGIAHATLRFYFDYESEADRNSVVTTNLIASMLITATGALVVSYWRENLAVAVFGNTGYANGISIILTTMVLELSSQVCLAYLRARELSFLFVILSFVKLLVQCATNTYMVVFRSAGVEGVLFGNLLAVGVGWLILIVFTIRNCGFRFEMGKAIPSLKYSFPFLLSTLTALASNNLDRILITRYRSLSLLGTFALATKFSGLLDFVIGEPFNRSYGAFRFSIMKDPDAGSIQSRVVRYLFVASVSAALGIALFAKDMLRLMSSPEYWGSVDVLPILLIASTFQILSYPFQTGVLYAKRTRYVFYINLLLGVVSVSFNFLLIPRIGVIGACLTQLACAVLGAFVNNRISQKYFPVKYDWGAMASTGGSAALAFLVARFLTPQAMIPGLLVKTVVFIGFLFLLIASGSVTREEIIWIRQKATGGVPSAPGVK
jgi:O-antigen/teichoic acid export membrane protein